MNPAREINLGFEAVFVFLRKMKLTLLEMAYSVRLILNYTDCLLVFF